MVLLNNMMVESLPKGWRLVYLDETDSTNEDVRRRRDTDPGEGLVVIAKRQNDGRGRRGRSWESPEGNLFLSVRLKGSDRGMADTALLSFVAAVALSDTFSGLAPHLDVTLKWPNDVLVSGAKVSGILLETDDPWVVLGIGVNILHSPKNVGNGYPVTSLSEQGVVVSASDVASFLCQILYNRVQEWREKGFEAVRRVWKARACGLNSPVVARFQNGHSLSGVFCDLDADGALVLRNEAGEHRILAADIFFS